MNFIFNLLLLVLLVIIAICKSRKLHFIGGGIVLCIVMLIANRSLTVPDTEGYVELFNGISTSFFDFNTYPELGYQFINKLFKQFTSNHTVFFFCLTLFNVFNLAYILKSHPSLLGNNKERNLLLFFVLYIAFFGYYYNAIVLRAGMAMLFVVNATLYACLDNMKKKDFLMMMLFQILAILFHVSSTIWIPVLFYVKHLNNERRYTKNLLILIISAFVYFTRIGDVIALGFVNNLLSQISLVNNEGLDFSRFSYYIDNGESSGIAFKYLFFLLSAFLFNSIDIKNNYYRKILPVYIVGIFIFSFLRSILIIERITDYFTLFSFVLYYILISNLHNSTIRARMNKIILTIAVCVIQFIFAFRIIN